MRDTSLVTRLDDLIFNKIANRVNPFKSSPEMRAYFGHMESDYEGGRHFDVSFGLFAALDSKTSALLTHISILLAAVSILYSISKGQNSDQPVEVIYRIFLVVELILYLTSTIFCLRCIRFAWPALGTKEDNASDVYSEIVKRQSIYSVASDIAICATAGLILILVIHFIAHVFPQLERWLRLWIGS